MLIERILAGRKKRFTNVSLTTATGSVVSLSAEVKCRPRTRPTPKFCR